MNQKGLINKQIVMSLIIAMAGFVFGIAETIYFWNNLTPQSVSETYCDFIATIMTFGGAAMFWTFGMIKLKRLDNRLKETCEKIKQLTILNDKLSKATSKEEIEKLTVELLKLALED